MHMTKIDVATIEAAVRGAKSKKKAKAAPKKQARSSSRSRTR